MTIIARHYAPDSEAQKTALCRTEAQSRDIGRQVGAALKQQAGL